MSTPPPGGQGTTSRIGRVGYSAAFPSWASAAALDRRQAVTASSTTNRAATALITAPLVTVKLLTAELVTSGSVVTAQLIEQAPDRTRVSPCPTLRSPRARKRRTRRESYRPGPRPRPS